MSTDGAANLGVWSRTTWTRFRYIWSSTFYSLNYFKFLLGELAMWFAAIICYFGEMLLH